MDTSLVKPSLDTRDTGAATYALSLYQQLIERMASGDVTKLGAVSLGADNTDYFV